MRACLLAHSFIMISAVFASQIQPVRVVRQQVPSNPIGQSTNPPQVTPGTTTQSTQSGTTASASTTTSPTAQSTATSTSPPSSLSSPSATASSSSAVSASSSNSDVSTTGSASSTDASSAALSTTTDSAGQTVTVTTNPSPSVSPSSSPDNSTPGGSSSGISTGTIIGLSVAGGVAAIAIIAFIIWKVTRKRFADLDDTNEAIKWPELNREHIGGESTDGLSREVSNYSSGAMSRDIASEHSDPYAVPPLPQFNPNQPYRDDPYAATTAGYYDPYRGPVPQTLHEDPMEGHENIPMNAYPSHPRTRSPGPAMSFDMGGRGSPAPGRMSPGPGLAYNPGDRGSPAPVRSMTSGMDRRASPGPHYAMGGQP